MPASDFSGHDPDFSEAQLEQCHRIIDGVRRLNARVMRLGGNADELGAAADRVESLLASLDDVTAHRDLESFRFEFDLAAPNRVIPFNPGTGEFNPLAPDIEMSVQGNRLVAHVEYSNAFESGPDTVQGGMVAAVWDQLLAYAVMIEGGTGPTLWLKVDFVKPTPITERLRFECQVVDRDRKKVRVEGRCYLGDEEVSRAEALCLHAYDIAVKNESAAD